MAEYRETESGQLEVRDPATGWRPTTLEDREAAERSIPEAIGTGFLGALKETASMIENITPAGINRNIMKQITGGEMGQSPLGNLAAADDEAQAANARQNPTANAIGVIGEMFIPGAPAAKVAKGARSGAKLGAEMAAESADAVTSGTQRGLIGRTVDTVKEAAQNQGQKIATGFKNKRSTVGAIRAIDQDVGQAVTVRTGQRSAGASGVDKPMRMIDTYGPVSDDLPISTHEQRWASASVKDGDAIDEGIVMREDAQRAKNTALSPGGHVQRAVEDERGAWGTMRTLDELGLVEQGYQRLTSDAIGAGFKQSGAVFKRLIDNAAARGTPIKAIADNAEETGSLQRIANAIDDLGGEEQVAATVKKHADTVTAMLSKPQVRGRDFQQVYNAVKRASDRFHKPGNAQPANAGAMDEIMDVLQEALGATLNAGEKVELNHARKQWGILSDLTRGKALDVNTGKINWTTYGNNRARHDRLFKTGRSDLKNNAQAERYDADVRALQALDQPMIPRTGEQTGGLIRGAAQAVGIPLP